MQIGLMMSANQSLYDDADRYSIEEYASHLLNKSLKDVIADIDETPKTKNKGSFGPVSYTHLTLPTICSV